MRKIINFNTKWAFTKQASQIPAAGVLLVGIVGIDDIIAPVDLIEQLRKLRREYACLSLLSLGEGVGFRWLRPCPEPRDYRGYPAALRHRRW